MKQKKTIFILSIFMLIVVGVTIAYYGTTSSFENDFITATYKTKTTETFESPDEWLPGQEVEKTIVTKNEGSIPVAVRVSYTESFVDENGDPITGLNINPVKINLDNMLDWVKEGNYYYYKYPLAPNDTTSSFMKSVTFNSYVGNNHSTCITEGNKDVCESSTDGIGGGTYTLTITKETVQYDAYEDAWNTNVVIEPVDYSLNYVNRQNEGSITVGDLVKFGNQEFYVFSTNSNKTELLTRYNLNVGDMNSNITEGIQDSSIVGEKNGGTTYGNVAFSKNYYWRGKVGTGLTYPGTVDPYESYEVYLSPYPYVYDSNSNLYNYVNNYKEELEHIGITVTNTRLLSLNDAFNMGCTYDEYDGEGDCSLAPAWFYETTFWLGNVITWMDGFSIYANGNIEIETVNGGGNSHSQEITGGNETWSSGVDENDSVGLRPIIEVPTSILSE